MIKDKIYLASNSPRRRAILSYYFNNISVSPLPHEIEPSPLVGEQPGKFLMRCIQKKWDAFCASHPMGQSVAPGSLLIVADTIVVIDNEILGKPKDPREAAQMLKRLSNRTHDVFTAFRLGRWQKAGWQYLTHIENSRVGFIKLRNAQINAYIKSGEPMDKAGSYGFQGLGMHFIKSCHGSYTNVMGLPMQQVLKCYHRLSHAIPRKRT